MIAALPNFQPRGCHAFGDMTLNCPPSPKKPSAAYSLHGFKTGTPQLSKSVVLRVATAAPWTRAIDAICASNCVSGRPDARLAAAIFGKTRAALLSKGRIRSAKSSSNIASTADSSAVRRLPLGRSSIPYKISACVMVVVNSPDAGSLANHFSTRAGGAGFITSDKTFVSRMIICRSEEDAASAGVPLQEAQLPPDERNDVG